MLHVEPVSEWNLPDPGLFVDFFTSSHMPVSKLYAELEATQPSVRSVESSADVAATRKISTGTVLLPVGIQAPLSPALKFSKSSMLIPVSVSASGQETQGLVRGGP